MKILITGGAGFIGINAAEHFLKAKHQVVILDNLSKMGSEKNLQLVKDYPNMQFIHGDIRNSITMKLVFQTQYDKILHLAAQTAVTTSVIDPMTDFETNVLGTLQLLEMIRTYNPEAHLIYTSTNKVYGNLEHVKYSEDLNRYTFDTLIKGINENMNLSFYSPYGCSKGAADQYVLDYAKIYNLNTTVLRQSCIYGIHQNGTEDQGWVAWFMKAFLENHPITIYGNGKQVRDVLYINDVIELYEKIYDNVWYGCFNVGGGVNNAISLIETIDWMKLKIETQTKISYDKVRPGDQKIFISDNSKLNTLGWFPTTNIDVGFNKLLSYLKTQ